MIVQALVLISSAQASRIEASVDALHYNFTVDHLKDTTERKEVNKKNGETFKEDWHEDVQLLA